VGHRFSFVFNFALALPLLLGLLTYAIENLDSNLSLLVGVGPFSHGGRYECCHIILLRLDLLSQITPRGKILVFEASQMRVSPL
jgi:hypothetical protein